MNGLRPNTGMLPYRGTSAGGGYSTVGDLLSFANAVQQNALLNAHYTDVLTVGKVKTPGGLIASAFADYEINGIRCFGHGGGSIGMNADLEVCPGPGYVVVVLANMDPPSKLNIVVPLESPARKIKVRLRFVAVSLGSFEIG
jgi:D-alanyl-D-alanine carboxypeptidase